jgi:hypothetical protein
MFRVRWPLALAVSIAFVALGWTAASALQARQERKVAVPPDDSSPQAFVRAYVAALDGGDCETAAALVHPDLREETVSSCVEGSGPDGLSIREPFRENPRWSGHNRGQQVVHVPVKFGSEWWGYVLLRGSSRDPWRIVDQGVA